ncbi:subunit of proteasome [Hamiltosporidium tvaerminnensis]|uniref:Subunit of proteasome n=2 Tax=Hamiltosporidium TaxID=1176354 RepID=A0A4Q9LBG8_9MICR|nr:proteasome core particle subunit beta 3 [Hamiltosporidium tvaerminnensis]TBT98267.1 subunit of proteasome [Hamiltosporidium magnivora]TBU01691.1 subunit of proteasome [Hamiltosporidium tvaerminnensis]TBU05074.1 hypothetical protein CWI36_0678p0010 [Hamiltosporidium magnivora]TBU13354.1 subunit of proteasome [Hamiltosporidium tvaerminnensis]
MSDISTHYGGSVLAIKGKSSIFIAADKRLGQGSITVNKDFVRIHRISPHLYISLTCFVPDAQVLLKNIIKNYNLFELKEGRKMEPQEFTKMVSFILYSKRGQPYYTEPVIAGVDSSGKPYIANMDQLGCISEPDDFVCAGTADKNLLGICEALCSKEMEDEELLVIGGQAFLNALDRDALSGWGGECYLANRDRVVRRSFKARQD